MHKIFAFCLTIIFLNSKAQTKLLSKYPFDKGGYSIIGLLSSSDPNDLQKELGEFYTDDIKVLNDLKKAWTFTKESPMYACGYHYSIYITHNGTILDGFEINLNCNVIATDKGYFYFDTSLLSKFKKSLKKPTKKKHSFSSITEGKNFISAIKQQDDLVLTFEPTWTKFEGKFTFNYINPDKEDDPDVVEKRLKQEIKKKYPNEDFKLTQMVWSSGGEYTFEMICNRSLFDQFTLYTKNENWKSYEPTLTTYWK